MSKEIFQVTCPECHSGFSIGMPVPEVRALLEPNDHIRVYKITSDMIKAFIDRKAKFYKPEAKTEIAVKYCERKKRKKSDPHISWASIRIAFSDDVLDKKSNEGWFDRLGNDNNVRFLEDIFVGFIRKYGYNKKGLDDILDSYTSLEDLEESMGITEPFIQDIRMYCTPLRVPTAAKESWVFFSARPEKIIEDMLENPNNDRVNGKLIIHSIHPLNKDSVEFTVYVHDKEVSSTENPLVRQMLTGGKLDKK